MAGPLRTSKERSGIAVGINKGHANTPVRAPRARPVLRKGRCSKRVKIIREIVREVTGLSPYERRMLELSKVGKEKRSLKLAAKKLGSLKRAKKKKDELNALQRKMAKH